MGPLCGLRLRQNASLTLNNNNKYSLLYISSCELRSSYQKDKRILDNKCSVPKCEWNNIPTEAMQMKPFWTSEIFMSCNFQYKLYLWRIDVLHAQRNGFHYHILVISFNHIRSRYIRVHFCLLFVSSYLWKLYYKGGRCFLWTYFPTMPLNRQTWKFVET